jgi:hypothetical protein
MRYDQAALRSTILSALPPGLVVSEHTEREHFYRINITHKGLATDPSADPLYPSVTGKLQILKDEGLTNFKMNRALEYIFANYPKFTDANIMEHIAAAERMPADIFEDAGDVGTRIHDIREAIFKKWIETGIRPVDFSSFIPEGDPDIRVGSAVAALQKFCEEKRYIPIATELKVYSHKYKVAGTLDDLGLMAEQIREGTKECDHKSDGLYGTRETVIIPHETKNTDACMRCGAKWKWLFVLMDVKTSNRFKDSYFIQVAMYFDMLRKLTGLKPERCFILKLSKEDRTYKVEDLKEPVKIARHIKDIIRINEGLEFIKLLRKDNQRKVLTI